MEISSELIINITRMKQLAVCKDHIGLVCEYKGRNAVVIMNYQNCNKAYKIDSTGGFQAFFYEDSIISIKRIENKIIYNDWSGNYYYFDCDGKDINNNSLLKIHSKLPYVEYSIIKEYIVGVTKDHVLYINGNQYQVEIDVQISQNSHGLFYIKEFNLISIVIYRLHTELYFIKVENVNTINFVVQGFA